MRLFNVPPLAESDDSGLACPAGGIGTGGFTFTSAGEFRAWQLPPEAAISDIVVPEDRFHVWWRESGTAKGVIKGVKWGGEGGEGVCKLFPFTWMDHGGTDWPIALECLCFSPVIPSNDRESSLPVYVIVWRIRNESHSDIEAAMMLTWACAWPEVVEGAGFDMQHDNLCLTGSLGRADSPNRIGIAVPDLHHAGIYLQGMEPWDLDQAEAIWEDFAEDGELEPQIARSNRIGAAAWVKFDLEPGEIKEIPFVIVWHFPHDSEGKERYYTQFLEKRRPDNAIVWLAEEAVQHYGQETPNWQFWIQQIEDSFNEEKQIPTG